MKSAAKKAGAPGERSTLEAAVAELARSRRDESAWRELYQQIWPFVMAINYRYLGGLRDLAQDAAQEVLFRLVRYCPFERLGKEAAFRAYVRMVCRNVCLTYLRKLGARREVTLGEIPEPRVILTDTDRQDERSMLRELLGQASKDLTEQEEHLLSLLASGLKAPEIAQAIGLSRENTHTRIHRLRRKLRNILLHGDLQTSATVSKEPL